MKNKRITPILRIIVEIAALAIFVVLFLNHKLQMWIILFGASALLSLLFGRFYCSWICPMNTSFKLISLVYGKIGIKRFKTPGFLKNGKIRFILLVLFVASMLITKKMGLKIDMLLYVTVFAVFLTLFFEENFWHRRLCPYGTILSLTSRPSRYRMNIDEAGCISCGKCQKVCPSDSIITLEDKKRRIIKHECLLCGKCADVCPEAVCQFKF
ncbi:MAG TPA: 4Fe-4S ferredoxin [Spirochaeta sp.]|nr:4Fe-4S ferredoxin [Spirochaeta sp.]